MRRPGGGRRPVATGTLLALAVTGPVVVWLAGPHPMFLAAACLAAAIGCLWPADGDGPAGRTPSAPRASDPNVVAWLPDPVILIDARGVVTGASGAAVAAFPGLRIGASLSLALRDPAVLEAVSRVRETAEPVAAAFGGRVATETNWEARVFPVPAHADGTGRRGAVALVLRDVGEQKRLETMRVDFVANVSHELRTPLASLLGFVETLSGPARDDAAARERFLPIMREQAERMKRLIENLLQLSRVELHEHVAPAAPLDLVPLARHMLDLMAPRADAQGTPLIADLPAEPVIVAGDRDELLRVVENLVENALRYGSPAGEAVTLALRPPSVDRPGWARLSVADLGPGIAADQVPRLTERFYRVDPAGSRERGGTGLGLAIAKHTVARHRGRLEIHSRPGEGSTFTVLLPALPASAASDVIGVSRARHIGADGSG